MQFDLNWAQRGMLILAGLLLTLFAINTWEGYDSDRWLASALFLAAVACFILSAKSKGKPNA